MTDPRSPAREYRARVDACDAALAALRARAARIVTVRVTTFLLAAAALLVVDVAEGAVARGAGVAALLLAGGFVLGVVAHRRVRASIRWEEALRRLAVEGGLRLERRWPELAESLPPAERALPAPPARHPFARDLDVVGMASLARLAGPVTSERGRLHLVGLLLDPWTERDVPLRQDAVRELAPEVDLRHAVAAHGRLHGAEDPPGTEDFLTWAEGATWIHGRAAVRLLLWVLPALLVALLVADLWMGAAPLWIAPALAQAELLRRFWRRAHGDCLLAEWGQALLQAYVPQLRLLEEAMPRSDLLKEVAQRLGRGEEGASQALRGLARLLSTAESRRNVVWVTVAPFLLLDLHLAAALDGWRRRRGARVRDWLEALGEWEVLAALAQVAHDHPEWTFPRVGGAAPPVLRARSLGHPLLPPAACVRNDVEVGPPGSFLLVTGSNMSGKSTLLRALGANVVLAGAGGPVCAQELELPRVRVRTSMRVDDSLAEGVSLFMAELLRIRDIVADSDARDEPPVLFLLDEILHGTNTAERRVAARAVIRHLLARDALGAVSTHDLTLARAPDLEAASRPVHFRETVLHEEGATRLTFDYRLRPGLATTRNALMLLEAVGLGGLVTKEDADDEVAE